MYRKRWAPASWRCSRGRKHAPRRTLRPGRLADVIRHCSSPGRPKDTRRQFHESYGMGACRLAGVGDLIEYETRVNYVIPKYEGPVICTYDLRKFGASVVMDALRTHPVVIIGGLLQENPFFVPPDQLLLEIRERQSARKSAVRRTECPAIPMLRSSRCEPCSGISWRFPRYRRRGSERTGRRGGRACRCPDRLVAA